MAKYKIIGVEHISGTSRKSGRPYDMDVLHVMAIDKPRNREFVGNEVDKITIGRDSGILDHSPVVGDVYDIGYNRAGYVEYAELCK